MSDELSQLARLARPIPAKYVKPPAQGKYGNYCDHEIITQILLKIVGPFSFQVEKVITNPDGIVDGCTASLTAVIDGREVTVTEAGDCEHADKKKTQGDRLKNAASDALKRCAMRLGLGLHIWAGDEDYFLFDQLWKESNASAEEDASASSPDNATTMRTDLMARASALTEAGVSLAEHRQTLALPTIRSSRVIELVEWDELLTRLENESAPFVANEDGTPAPTLLETGKTMDQGKRAMDTAPL